MSAAETVPPVAEYQDEYDDGVTHAWRIENVDSADWALSRLADLEREIAENELICARRVQEMTLRTALLNERAAKGAAFFRMRLTEFAKEHREALLGGGKKKTRKLTSGEISFRKSGGVLVVKDADALLAWAQSQPVEKGFVRTTEAPSIPDVKSHFKLTGELPPGCDVEPEAEEINVKAAPRGSTNGF